jgi:hypothetical protein
LTKEYIYITWFIIMLTHEVSQFSQQRVLQILNTCVLVFFMLCLWSDQSELMAVFMVFNLWVGQGFIFESCS